MKIGDTVRYLNAVGGGKVLRIDGKIAYIDDEGFETPVHVSELVVVMPAGHTPDRPGRTMFDQKAFDAGRNDSRGTPKTEQESIAVTQLPEEEEFPIEETDYGDEMTIVIAFEPKDVKKLAETEIRTYLVNDSNYFLDYQLLKRADKAWESASHGTAAPNELVDLGVYTQDTVKQLERIVFQAIVYKKDKAFDFKPPISASRKLDLTKFYKLHCFRPGIYFDTPVLEVQILTEGIRS